MSVQDNVKRVEQLTEIAKNHLSGGKLFFEDGKVKFFFHYQLCGLGGVQVCLAKGKINALTLLIKRLDELYNKEFGWTSNFEPLASL